jgi:hypothetical protein
MMTAVWVAVLAAAAAWVIGVGVAVYVMLKAARLISASSAAVGGLRERGDLLISRANAAVDRAGDQIARTEAVTASMDDVTATMTELGDSLSALTPAVRTIAGGVGGPLMRIAALVYGFNRAVGLRRYPLTGGPAARISPRAGANTGTGAVHSGARAALTGRRAALTGRRAALTGRSDGTTP